MTEPVYTIVGSDEPPATACASVSDFSMWKLDTEAAENARLETLERKASAPPPYLYRGRKERCFFRPKKTRWRKG